MTYAANWSRRARNEMHILSQSDAIAVRAAVSVMRGRMPEVAGVAPVAGTGLEFGYEVQPRKVLGILFVRPRSK